MTTTPATQAAAPRFPIPATISPEAQAVLAQPSMYGDVSQPDPSDKAAWERYVADGNAALTPIVAQRFGGIAPERITEHRLAHATLYEIEPVDMDAGDAAILYVHGGGFIVGFGIAAAYAAYEIAALTRLRTYSIDYRTPPSAPFPAGLDDTVEAYRFLLDRHPAQKIAGFGGSAGGGLLASAILKARDLGLPLPAACCLQSPEADLTESGDSFEVNAEADGAMQRLTNAIAIYADGHDLTDPYLSPLFGDFTKGFPPTILTCGTREMFLSNTVLMHRALRRADMAADLHIWEAMGHAGFNGVAPEDKEVMAEHARFIRAHV